MCSSLPAYKTRFKRLPAIMIGLFGRAENAAYALVMTEHTQYKAIDIFQQKTGNRLCYVVLKSEPTVVLRVWFWSFGMVAEEPAQVCRRPLLAGWIVHFLNLNPSFAGCSSSGHLLPYWNKREHTELQSPRLGSAWAVFIYPHVFELHKTVFSFQFLCVCVCV